MSLVRSLSHSVLGAALSLTLVTPAFAAPNNPPPQPGGGNPQGGTTTTTTPITCSTANAPILSGITVANGAAAWNYLSGQRSVPNNGLVGCGVYSSGFTLGWTVSYNATTHLYAYDYSFSGFTGQGNGMSHVIFQLTPGCDQDPNCVLNASPVYGTYTSTSNGGSNPGLIGSIYGAKFDMNGATSGATLSFLSSHAPVWGDFYVKAGLGYAYNANAGLAQGDLMGYVVRPDGVNTPPVTATPEPASVALFGTGLLALAGVVVRRRRKA
jgi:PEP-CTERM motif